jgi:hypothetical protein
MRLAMTLEQIEERLCESLKGVEPSFEQVMREDFRKLEARFVCRAVGVEEERCVRYKYHCRGCTFRSEGGECRAEAA